MNRAVTQLGASPWYTTLLFYPEGTTLLGQTLNPFNGFAAIPLLRVLSLVEVHNLVVLFGFVGTGVTGFWLARHLTGSYWGALAAGWAVTFSPFHMAHADGHLQLVSMEWVPLFMLLWWRLISAPTVRRGVAAGVVLFLVLLCDYYYFTYCVLAGGMVLVWRLAAERRRWADYGWARLPLSMAAFAIVAAALCLPLPLAVAAAHQRDPLVGAHDPEIFSADLLAPFIPGGRWGFSILTEPFWSRLIGNLDESSVYLGWSVLLVSFYGLIHRQRERRREGPGRAGTGVWWFILAAFYLFSLGPVPHLWGRPIRVPFTPYRLLEEVLPPLKLSGVPARMMAMATLAAAVLFAYGFRALAAGNGRRRKVLVGLVLALLLVEYLPDTFPLTPAGVPLHVQALRRLPERGAVVDLQAGLGWSLYYQTVHEKPLAFGYISRTPASLEVRRRSILLAAQRGNYADICRRPGVGYLVVEAEKACPGLRLLYRDGSARIYACPGKVEPGKAGNERRRKFLLRFPRGASR